MELDPQKSQSDQVRALAVSFGEAMRDGQWAKVGRLATGPIEQMCKIQLAHLAAFPEEESRGAFGLLDQEGNSVFSSDWAPSGPIEVEQIVIDGNAAEITIKDQPRTWTAEHTRDGWRISTMGAAARSGARRKRKR